MIIRITIETDNDAFTDSAFGPEVREILARLAQDVVMHPSCTYFPLADSNGNKVGEYNLGG